MNEATTGLDTGVVRGASVQSWRAANPRELLKGIMEANRGADRIALFRLFRERLKEDDAEDFLETIVEYWFANNYQSLVAATIQRSRATREEALAESAPMVATMTAAIKERIAEAATVVLSEMTMPNGKRLADCTGGECARMGGWLRSVGRRVGSEQTVGAVLAEADLKVLYSKAR